jgi:hypothetical protein
VSLGIPLLVSAAFSVGCAAASARRLAWAVSPTGRDHAALLAAIGDARGEEARARLAAALGPASAATWESALLEATSTEDEGARTALVNEQLTELELLGDRWAGVPRVCVRLATSVGFLCATVSLIQGLALPFTDSFAEDMHDGLMTAMGALAAGLAGAAFCAAVHFRARRARTMGAAVADKLVEALAAAA